MMKKTPSLVVMAAGLGSRYGGLKQMAAVDEAGHKLIDYAVYDACRAGFEDVVFVISPHLEEDFRVGVGNCIERHVNVRYAYQLPHALPPGFSLPVGRVKPWGTAHAVLSAKELVQGNFAAINADDYYGVNAFRLMYDFLCNEAGSNTHGMVGYRIENTLSEFGSVARGVCGTDTLGNLNNIVERTHIVPWPGGAAYIKDGKPEVFFPSGTIVSMNMWGFGLSMMDEIEIRFAKFLKEHLPTDPLKCEYGLPWVPNAMLKEGKATFRVLPTYDKWYGVTYSEDMPFVQNALKRFKAEGIYPENLWGCR